jgi:hypothetical protein
MRFLHSLRGTWAGLPTAPRRLLGFLREVFPGKPWPLLLAACVLVGAMLGLQLGTLKAPITGEHNWRQADTYTIAYNFVHESSGFFYPKVDWSRGRSGIMGMEMPVYTYTTAQWMRVLGDSPLSGRLVSWLSLLLGLGAVFVALRPVPQDWRLAADDRPNPRWLPFGILCFAALSPLFFFEGRQVQPDPMMAGLAAAAAACFHSFARCERWPRFALGMLVYCLAVGAKTPAIIAGPALWLLSFSASPRLRWHTPIVRGLPFLLPLAMFWGWDKWAHHLDEAFNGGEHYFAIDMNLRDYLNRLKDREAMKRAFSFVFPSYCSNWVLSPLLLTGFVLGFRRGFRALSLPLLLWLLIGLFFCAGTERLTWHWYYAFMIMLPLHYFGGLGVAALFEGVAAYEQTSVLARWGMWSGACALALTRWVGGEPGLLQQAIGASYPPGPSWTDERSLHWLLDVLLLGMVLAYALRFRGARWLARAAVAAALALSIPRAIHDVREVTTWRSRKDLWPDMEKHWIPMRRELDRVSTRKDVFLSEGGNPWYLYLALRKGFVFGDTRDALDLDALRKSGVRFYLHYAEHGALHPLLANLPLLRRGELWELYCFDPNGCAKPKQ